MPPILPDDATTITLAHWAVGLIGGLAGVAGTVIIGAFRAGGLYRDFKNLEIETRKALAAMDKRIVDQRTDQLREHSENREELRRIEQSIHTVKNELQQWPVSIGKRLDDRIDGLFERLADLGKPA